MECPIKISESAGVGYLEKLREITKDDFEIAGQHANSFKFIIDPSWMKSMTPTTSSTKPVFMAYFAIKFKWSSYLLDSIKELQNLGEVKEALRNMDLLPLQLTIHHSFHWRGCTNQESRERKLKKEELVFNQKIEELGDDKISYVYSLGIKKINQMVLNANSSWKSIVVDRIVDNLDSISLNAVSLDASYLALEERVSILNSYINDLKIKMEPLSQELNEIRSEQRKMKLSVVQEWFKKEAIPDEQKNEIISIFEKKKEDSYGQEANRFRKRS